MTLLIDIGNSRIKAAQLLAGRLEPLVTTPYDRAGIADWCADNLAGLKPPAAIWVANVAGQTVAADLQRWCEDHWQVSPRFVASERAAGGVRNGYIEVSELGVDRWLGLVAARQRYTEAVCVIGAGTALTVDAVAAAGEHLGGVILPGAGLMQQALRQATHAVQVDTVLPQTLALGRSTDAGVAAGSGYAIVGLIEHVVGQLRVAHGGDWTLLMTGGAAAAIAPLCPLSVRVETHLVLEGLAWYARERA
ncbi:type III pantothenate kinase [Methylohalomonas lacus]|uniref:Type III pantothenate kinase n=1 Tax=Methylohalomonas lacus TaxID=398773 RepID=A0AAE3L192_9GAMM|nr:type III pantothenate kinase [Methylohalomonas lacus]MCS3903654.1 type III pantothenate kinase [Methylohalomonas lacus]